MATGNKLEVQIGADVTDFQKKIKEVEFDIKELSKVKLEKIKLGLDTTQITAQIKDAKNSLNGLKTAVKDSGNSFAGAAPKIANGSNALMQFSRIAQDAPYGIIGIGNNITSTVEAFSHLKNSTGSTGGALKALASSLMGTGGILLGVSLLTTGLTLLSQSGLSVGDIIDKVTGKFDEYGASLKKVNEEVAKSSGEEIANMKALLSVAQDKTLSDEKRLIAVENLQKQYPAYFGSLEQEKILNGEVAKTVDDVSKALIARADASAIAGKLGELSAQRLVLEEKRESAILGIKESQAKAAKDKSIYNVKDVMTLKDEVDTYNKIRQELKKLDEQRRKYSERLSKDKKESILLDIPNVPKTNVKKQPKTFNTPQVDGVSQIIPIELQIPAVNTEPISTAFKGIRQTVSSELLATQELLYNFSLEVSDLIENSLGSALTNVGSSIGTALAEGTSVIDALGASLLQALGGFLSELGKKMISYGLLLAGFGAAQKAFESGDATVKIGAGLAMVALGIAVTAAGGAINSMGSKGMSKGTSTATGSTANNTSSTSGSSGGWSGGGSGTVVFEIAGTSLIGVLNNTTQRNLRIGGK